MYILVCEIFPRRTGAPDEVWAAVCVAHCRRMWHRLPPGRLIHGAQAHDGHPSVCAHRPQLSAPDIYCNGLSGLERNARSPGNQQLPESIERVEISRPGVVAAAPHHHRVVRRIDDWLRRRRLQALGRRSDLRFAGWRDPRFGGWRGGDHRRRGLLRRVDGIGRLCCHQTDERRWADLRGRVRRRSTAAPLAEPPAVAHSQEQVGSPALLSARHDTRLELRDAIGLGLQRNARSPLRFNRRFGALPRLA